jgi:P pilus assembly chaperone PapD
MNRFRSNPEKQRGRSIRFWPLCFIFFAFFAMMMANWSVAQTVQPIIQQYEGVGKGSFDVINQGDTPLVVTFSLESFTVKESGEMWFRPLDEGIQVKLSAMSLRLAPRETSRVFYTAEAKQLPAWFVIYSSFGAPPRKDITGLNLQFQLPHVVYLLPRHAAITKDDLKVVANYDSSKQIVHCTVENQGKNFGRMLELQAVASAKRQDGPTGGIFPGSRRIFDIDWKYAEPPQKVVLQFKNLKLEQSIVSGD